jgi:hypothetical protein
MVHGEGGGGGGAGGGGTSGANVFLLGEDALKEGRPKGR